MTELNKKIIYWDIGNKKQIYEQYWVDKNNKKEGLYIRWHKNGVIWSQSDYNAGVLHGLTQDWYETGYQSLECTFKHGNLHGIYRTWYENGRLESECEYNNGTLIKVNRLYDIYGRNCCLTDTHVIDIEVWKICKAGNTPVYVKLLVPRSARRITPINNDGKFISRVEFALVEKIFDRSGREYNEAKSFIYKDATITYRYGKIVKANGFNSNPQDECGQGINVHLYKDQCDIWI